MTQGQRRLSKNRHPLGSSGNFVIIANISKTVSMKTSLKLQNNDNFRKTIIVL